MQTFVTGGTGLLGNTLVRQLVAEGHDVTALVRSPEKARDVLGDVDVALVTGDMRDVDSFADALSDCDVVFHTAAYFREYYAPGDHRETLQAVNVDGTIDLLRAADAAGIDSVVYVSSAGVVGPAADGGPGDETTILAPEDTDNLYFRSKIAAERAIDEFEKGHDLPIVRVLPGWMFGPRDYAPTSSGQLIVDLVNGDLGGIFEGGGDATDVRDVASAMIAAVDRGRPGEHYLVSGPDATLAEIASIVERQTGVAAPRTLPYPLVALVARLGVLASRITGEPPLLTPQGVATLRSNTPVSSAKAERDLDVDFRPLAETIADEIRWFAERGAIDVDLRTADRRSMATGDDRAQRPTSEPLQ